MPSEPGVTEKSVRELMYYANPLFTVSSLIDYRSIQLDNRPSYRWVQGLVWAHDPSKNVISANLKTIQSMVECGIEITELLLEYILLLIRL